MYIWLIILAASALTFAIRISFIVLQGDREFPAAIKGALRFVPASVLAAIVWPAVVAPHKEMFLSPANLQLYAALVAAAVAWKTKNILATLAAGMGLLWLLQWITR
jgi:branched-subunit amino acid transport protein